MSDDPVIVKMSGAGNDFVVVRQDARRSLGDRWPAWVRDVCRRGLSVGADGILVVEAAGSDRIRATFYNPDASEAFCGNGTRCAARFAFLEGWVGRRMVVETAVGEVVAEVIGERVRLDLPPPEDLGAVSLRVSGTSLHGRFILAGVPHFVVRVDAVDDAPLARWGPVARRHPAFGEHGTNLDLVSADAGADGILDIRTWERGVEGETLACGSGAVASGFAARLAGAGEIVRLRPRSGRVLEITLPGPPEAPTAVLLEGDARRVFVGRLSPEAIG